MKARITFTTAAATSPSHVPSPTLPACSELAARDELARDGARRRGRGSCPGIPRKSPTTPPSVAPTSACGLAPTRLAPSSEATKSATNESAPSTPMIVRPDGAHAREAVGPGGEAEPGEDEAARRGCTGSTVPSEPDDHKRHGERGKRAVGFHAVMIAGMSAVRETPADDARSARPRSPARLARALAARLGAGRARGPQALRVRRPLGLSRDAARRRAARRRSARSPRCSRSRARRGTPVVARGSGTGLSGGALPLADGILLSLAQVQPRRRGRSARAHRRACSPA